MKEMPPRKQTDHTEWKLSYGMVAARKNVTFTILYLFDVKCYYYRPNGGFMATSDRLRYQKKAENG